MRHSTLRIFALFLTAFLTPTALLAPRVALAAPIGGTTFATSPGSAPAYAFPIQCIGGTTDDGATVNSALVRHRVLSIVGPCTIVTQVTLASYTHVWLNGAAIAGKVATNGGTSAVFYAAPTNQGSPLTLAADTVVGATTFTLTTNTGVVTGAWIAVGHPTKEFVQLLQVKSVAGSGNPYTVTADRPLSFVTPASGGQALVESPPIAVGIHGGGAVITASSAATRDRGIELSGCVDCIVEDVAIEGPFVVGAALDVGSLRSTVQRVRVKGDGAATTVGVASESNESCAFRDLYMTGIAVGGSNAGLFAYNCRASTFDGITVANNVGAYGAGLDLDGGAPGQPGSDGCALSNSTFTKNIVGVILANAATNWTLSGVTASWSVSDGVQLATLTSGVPSNNRLRDLVLDHNGNDGILIAAGANTTISGARVTSNALHGIEVTAGTGTVVRDGSIEGNGTSGAGWGVKSSTSALVTGVRFSAGHDGGVQNVGTGIVTMSGCTFADASANVWFGVWQSGTGRSRVTDSTFALTGSVVSAGVVVNAGDAVVRGSTFTGGSASYALYATPATTSAIYYDLQDTSIAGTTNPTTGTVSTPAAQIRKVVP